MARTSRTGAASEGAVQKDDLRAGPFERGARPRELLRRGRSDDLDRRGPSHAPDLDRAEPGPKRKTLDDLESVVRVGKTVRRGGDELPRPEAEPWLALSGDRVELFAVPPGRGRARNDLGSGERLRRGDERRRLSHVFRETDEGCALDAADGANESFRRVIQRAP